MGGGGFGLDFVGCARPAVSWRHGGHGGHGVNGCSGHWRTFPCTEHQVKPSHRALLSDTETRPLETRVVVKPVSCVAFIWKQLEAPSSKR